MSEPPGMLVVLTEESQEHAAVDIDVFLRWAASDDPELALPSSQACPVSFAGDTTANVTSAMVDAYTDVYTGLAVHTRATAFHAASGPVVRALWHAHRSLVTLDMEERHMQQLIYAMQFKGQAAPVEGATGVLRARTQAQSCTMTSTVGPEGLAGTINPAAGGVVEFKSEVTFTGESSFLESGTISFGDNGHRLRFSTLGQGYLGPSPEAGVQHGAVTWRIDDGEGQLAGAHGLITSNFLVGPNGEVTDHHLGVIYLADA